MEIKQRIRVCMCKIRKHKRSALFQNIEKQASHLKCKVWLFWLNPEYCQGLPSLIWLFGLFRMAKKRNILTGGEKGCYWVKKQPFAQSTEEKLHERTCTWRITNLAIFNGLEFRGEQAEKEKPPNRTCPGPSSKRNNLVLPHSYWPAPNSGATPC